jgi:hypothetical protein
MVTHTSSARIQIFEPELPRVTTWAKMRGYQVENGELVITNGPRNADHMDFEAFVKTVVQCIAKSATEEITFEQLVSPPSSPEQTKGFDIAAKLHAFCLCDP